MRERPALAAADAGVGSSTRTLARTPSRLLGTLERASGTVNDVAFSPDGSLLATASDDHTAALWH